MELCPLLACMSSHVLLASGLLLALPRALAASAGVATASLGDSGVALRKKPLLLGWRFHLGSLCQDFQ